MRHWSAAQLQTLARMREGFLTGSAGHADYWAGPEDLALYDSTFARRIGWKWEAVLGELELRKWDPPAARLIDLGCGSGIASRTVLRHWPGRFEELTLLDRSAHARAFAAARVREEAPNLRVRESDMERMDSSGALVLVSHVMTELNDAALAQFVKLIGRAAAVLWVEAGTHEAGRRLVQSVREPLRGEGWRSVAPCTHGGACPMQSGENARHWCHHFARVPSEVHQDAAWRELAGALGVDLRVLPYSFWVGERASASVEAEGWSRVIGNAREFKGYLKVLSCGAEGLWDWVLQKRDAPGAFKELVKGAGVPLYRWETEEGRIVSARRLGAEQAE